MNIIVNGKERSVATDELTYELLVYLATGDPWNGQIYTVIFRNGTEKDRKGSLSPGDWTYGKEGMIFNVALTDGA